MSQITTSRASRTRVSRTRQWGAVVGAAVSALAVWAGASGGILATLVATHLAVGATLIYGLAPSDHRGRG